MERLKTHKFEKLLSGQAENVEDFFEKLIKPQFVHKEIIKKLHKTIMDYVNLKDATLFLRLYGSGKPYSGLRRGFLTEYPDKTKMVFCDNTFSMIFAGLKIGGYSLSAQKLAEYFRQPDLICSFGLTREEKELSYYSPQKAIRVGLNSLGWYQAHIKPTGYGYGEIAKKNLPSIFPKPDRSEWGDNKIRTPSINPTNEEKQLLIAHFIRLVHPLNSFLVPKRNHIEYSGKRRIGEEDEIINQVRDYLSSTFPEEYDEFNKITLPFPKPGCNTSLTDFKWFEYPVAVKPIKTKSIVKNKDQSNTSSTINDSEEESEIALDEWLKSIGKTAFVEILFPSLKENVNVSYKEIAKKYPKFASYKTQKNRLATAKSIFQNGLEMEALQIIAHSSKLNPNVIEKAKAYLKT